MKYIDINKRFTEIVSEYIATGYMLNTASMNGSEGEISKVDLTDGKEILRVLITNFHDSECRYNLNGVEIVVGRVPEEDRVTPHDDSNWFNPWNTHLEKLRQERFFQVGENRRGGRFFGTQEDAEAAEMIRFQRFRSKYN